MTKIDSTARIEDGAVIGEGVTIGPYCVIGANATIGPECQLLSHVTVSGHTTLGAGSVVHPFAALGGAPQAAAGRVRRVEHLGDQTRLHLSVNGIDLVTLAEPHTGVQPGEEVAVAPVAPLFFDAEGRRLRAA